MNKTSTKELKQNATNISRPFTSGKNDNLPLNEITGSYITDPRIAGRSGPAEFSIRKFQFQTIQERLMELFGNDFNDIDTTESVARHCTEPKIKKIEN